VTFDEMHPDLLDLLSPAGALPDVPAEAEEFFTQLVAQFPDKESCRQYIAANVSKWFRCLRGLPDWIQEADWPWARGHPMVFVGSIDAPRGVFHDDARFYLFWCPESGATQCVIQVA
jgi:hypothetical protein